MGDGSVTQSWGLLWCATLCLEMSLAGHHLWVPLRSDVLGSSPSTHPLPQIPIQESLIEFTDNSVNKLATEAFQGGHSPPPSPCPVGGQMGCLLQPACPTCCSLGGSLALGKGWVSSLSPPAVMKFMGDHPLRGQTELDIVCTILKVNPAAQQ